MTGIEVHTTSPINSNVPTKSKETTAEPIRTQNVPTNVAATTTAYAVNSAQSAIPGAGPPTPTAAASAYTPTQTTASAYTPTRTTALPATSNPPPPQPGQVPEADRGRPSQTPAPPAQVSWNPSYAYAQPPKGVTSVAKDLSHPPGYIQNAQEFEDRKIESNNTTHTQSPRGGGLLDGMPALRDSDDTPIWDTAMNWAKEAGRKLSVAENEVWKKINGEK